MPPHSRKMSQRNASGGRGSASSSEPKEDAEASTKASIENTIIRLKRQVNSERQAYVKEKIEANTENLRRFSRRLLENADQRASMNSSLGDKDLLSVRIQRALSKFGAEASGAQDGIAQDDSSAPIVVGSTSGSKSVVKPVRLQAAQKIPPYTTWIFLNRNQRMAEDQSVLGRRRIYYDSAGNEALICSDSEEEQVEEEEEKREFSKGDDFVIRNTVQEHGVQKAVWKALADCVDAKASDIEARYHTLMAEAERGGIGKLEEEKFQDLSSAMDSFDNLFCRRCLVFDCRLHGCSQPVVLPCEKQPPMKKPGDLPGVPCGPCCFHQTRLLGTAQAEASCKTEDIAQDGRLTRSPKKGFFDKRVNALRKLLKRKAGRPSDDDTDQARKRPRGDTDPYIKFDHGNNVPLFASSSLKQRVAKKLVKLKMSGQAPSRLNRQATVKKDDDSKSEISSSARKELNRNWNALEKGLYENGVQIFGRDSCLISKNLLRGLKTCVEVGEFMQLDGWRPPDERTYHIDGLGATLGENADGERSRPRLYNGRRRGRVRKLKYTWKSVGPSLRKRLEGKEGCRQYTPCSCTSTCGKQCSCIRNSTCCEKYCGCSKACKNRFRGCHCAKSQCSSRQCPCFAAGRECDPDVCRNCWVGCGDGSLGDPPSRGDSYECRNMKLLLKQQQRVLLGRSDVAGWGAFLKTPVNKHDYLGEYTGELISHREADKRGKIYDRENSSFLFNLNDQYVLDACRKGDKLKFANHSPNPNCYAKVIMVAGDHRVGIFAKERIAAGEELFYDYRYEADRAPAWARKPEDNHKHDETGSGSGRAQKTA